MAPSFLSKLVKPSSPRSSESSTSTPPRSSFSATIPTTTSNNNSPYSTLSPVSARTGSTSDSFSTNPSVTVIPPSPRTDTHQSLHSSQDSVNSANRARSKSTNSPQSPSPIHSSTSDRRAISFSTTTPVVNSPAPTPIKRPTNWSTDTDGTLKGGLPRILSPASSTGNLREFVQSASHSNSPAPTPRLAHDHASPSTLSRPSSSQSIRSQTGPASAKTITGNGDAAESRRRSGELPASPTTMSDNDGHYIYSAPIVDSPPAYRTEFSSLGDADNTTTGNTLNPDLLGPRADSDSISIVSATTGKKKRSWRRSSISSPTRKPTGLASAIAASGLAMVNPAMTVPQFSPTNDPYTSNTQTPKANGKSQSQHQVAASRKSSNPSSFKASTSSGSVNRHRTQESLDLRPGRVASVSSKNSRHSHTQRRVSMSRSQTSFDSASEGGSELGEEGVAGTRRRGSGDEDDDEDDDDLDLDLDEDDIPVTGFAVASNKRNADFHELFPSIPEGDYLIEDYGCALQREILIQGRIYISENHICFHANIFGWITDLSIPIYEITSLERKMTAFVIPNAIQLTTRQAKYTFASFLARDTTYDVIYNIWRLARPDDVRSITSGVSLDGGSAVGRVGMDEVREDGSSGVAVNGVAGAGAGAAAAVVGARKQAAPLHKATQCACGKEGRHYSETALDTLLPGTPDKIYNLIFTSGFIKDFMRVEQKLLDVQISDWSPVPGGDPHLLARNMSYIKPLNGSLGPKQTKCEIHDETVHCDFDEFVSTVTTTRTPEVPSGGAFSVKTRTCVMWASPASSRVIVTTQVEWTGRSFIKGIIEKSAIDGQKVYHADLDKAMRMYVQEHQTEFVPAGMDPAVVAASEPSARALLPPATPTDASALPLAINGAPLPSSPDSGKQREHERNRRGLQWAWDTLSGASAVAKQSTDGAIELLRDAWDQSSGTTILWFVIVLLVGSNLWTLMIVGSREEVGRRKELRRMEEREKWVQGVVTALWDELAAGRGPGSVTGLGLGLGGIGNAPPTTGPSAPVGAGAPSRGGDPREELAELSKLLDAVEERVQRIRQSVASLD